MINPLKVASSGYLKKGTKAVLIIAVAGYLNFGGAPLINQSGDGVRKHEKVHRADWREKVRREDEEILAFIKMFIECQG